MTAAQNVFGLEEPDYGKTQVVHSSYQFGNKGKDFTKKIRSKLNQIAQYLNLTLFYEYLKIK